MRPQSVTTSDGQVWLLRDWKFWLHVGFIGLGGFFLGLGIGGLF